MAVALADTILHKTPDDLYKMVESGWNATVARVELTRRGLPTKRPKVKAKRGSGSPRFKAKRHCGVTGGHVDLSKHTPLPRETMPGQNVEPWNRY